MKPVELPRCRAIQQSDEMFCSMCGLRWDVNDSNPPKCQEGENWMAREARLAQYGDLNAGIPNSTDHSVRGFQPK